MSHQAAWNAKSRRERKERGEQELRVWLSPSSSQTLKSLEAKGLSRTQAVERGIDLVAKEVE